MKAVCVCSFYRKYITKHKRLWLLTLITVVLLVIADILRFNVLKKFIDFDSFFFIEKISVRDSHDSQINYSQPRVVVGVYQEMRTLPQNLQSWKKYIITPIIEYDGDVKLMLSIHRTAEESAPEIREDKIRLKTSLNETGLLPMGLFYEEFVISDFDKEFLNNLMSRADENVLDPTNPLRPLFVQYMMRNRVCNLVMQEIQRANSYGGNYDFVVLLRSDIVFGSSIWDEILPRHVQKVDLSSNVVWTPRFEDYNGTNDRFMVMTVPAFQSYFASMLIKLRNFLAGRETMRGKSQQIYKNNKENLPAWKVNGENIHKYMLRQIEYLRHIPVTICYGVARRVQCVWTPYGTPGCHALKLPLLSDTYRGENYFHAHVHCRSNKAD